MNNRQIRMLEAAAGSNFNNYSGSMVPKEQNFSKGAPALVNVTNTPVIRAAGTTIYQGDEPRTTNKKSLQLDITLKNEKLISGGTATDILTEIFNQQNSFTRFQNVLSDGSVNQIVNPVDATYGLTALGSSSVTSLVKGVTANPGFYAYFDQYGNLIVSEVQAVGAANVIVNRLTISCKQTNMRSLMEYTGKGSMRIDRMQLNYATDAQINNDFSYFQKTFLGVTQSETITPQSYFSVDQFQPLKVLLEHPITIDAEKGLIYKVNSGETMTILAFVSDYTKSAL